ncbi:MAG: ABC transporter permease [Spirochaetaceae bacterium]
MYIKMLKKDFKRKKVITITLFAFIVISSLFMSSGVNLILDLTSSVDNLFDKAKVPDFLQQHQGDIDINEINSWASNSSLISDKQVSKMIHIKGSSVWFSNSTEPLKDDVIELAFVRQNPRFDLLLDLQNKPIHLSPGEISIPLFFMEKYELKVGDSLEINQAEGLNKIYSIKSFSRDALMGPSIISTKRLLLSDKDFNDLEEYSDGIEFLISFTLNNREDISEFSKIYSSSDLPKKGPAVDYNLFKVMNALTDGLIASVIILISFLLIIIAVLCIRYTILSTIEEDYKEIGVMKAIGFKYFEIMKMYMMKYFIESLFACIIGYVISFKVNSLLSSNILLYFGTSEKTEAGIIIPVLAVILVFCLILFFCYLTLRRFKRISAVDAIRLGNSGETYKNRKLFSLKNSKVLSIDMLLALKDVVLKSKSYGLIFFLFVIAVFIVILPLNFYTTIKSPNFVSYMGMGKSDVLINVRQSDTMKTDFESILKDIQSDPDVTEFARRIICRYIITLKNGEEEDLLVESGDINTFPVIYSRGSNPMLINEISISSLTAQDLDIGVGEYLLLEISGEIKKLVVTGIYQDITNGGKTARAKIQPDHDLVMWYMIQLNVLENNKSKIKGFENRFPNAKITSLDGYIDETFGSTLEQLELLTFIALTISICISILISSLFIKMLTAKEFDQIAIMKSLGFKKWDIQKQYITRGFIILLGGLIFGSILANTLGSSIMGGVLSGRGISEIRFIINPLLSYILYPTIFFISVFVTIFLSTLSIQDISITKLQAE